MTGKQTKLVLLAAGILLTVGFLLVVGMNQPGGMYYYITVPEFLDLGQDNLGDFRISGKVLRGSIDRDPGGRDVSFVMYDGDARLPVHYHGPIPDAFAEEVDVVVQGRMGDGDLFQAHTLIAKCPSKYEAAEGHPDDIPMGK
jgi:cytochrome c-type biogenesis protein CcmE